MKVSTKVKQLHKNFVVLAIFYLSTTVTIAADVSNFVVPKLEFDKSLQQSSTAAFDSFNSAKKMYPNAEELLAFAKNNDYAPLLKVCNQKNDDFCNFYKGEYYRQKLKKNTSAQDFKNSALNFLKYKEPYAEKGDTWTAATVATFYARNILPKDEFNEFKSISNDDGSNSDAGKALNILLKNIKSGDMNSCYTALDLIRSAQENSSLVKKNVLTIANSCLTISKSLVDSKEIRTNQNDFKNTIASIENHKPAEKKPDYLNQYSSDSYSIAFACQDDFGLSERLADSLLRALAYEDARIFTGLITSASYSKYCKASYVNMTNISLLKDSKLLYSNNNKEYILIKNGPTSVFGAVGHKK